MATLNELGRNSSSISYTATAGADMWSTFTLTDQWLRNDALQGTATASGSTVTGVSSTIFTTQVRAGDSYSIGGQVRTVAAVSTDSSFTVTTPFNFSVTTPSQIKRINTAFQTNLTGTLSATVRGNTAGTVAVTNGAPTVTGTGTYFYSDATNSVALVTPTGTVAIDASGNITGSGTLWQSSVGAGIPTSNSLQPGDCIAVTGTFTGATSSATSIFYLVVNTVTSDTAATCVTAPPVAITAGATLQKCTNGVAGRTILINGRPRIISSISSNTSMILTSNMDFTDSNLKYKTYPRGTAATATPVTVGAANVSSSGTTITIPSTTGSTIPPGSGFFQTAGTGIIPTGTYIAAVNPAAGQTTFTASSAPSPVLASATLIVIPPSVTITGGGLIWDLVDNDNVWIGDEVRAWNFFKTLTTVTATAGAAPTLTCSNTVGLYPGMTVIITAGGTNSSTLTTNCTITNVLSATTFTISGTLTNNLAGSTTVVCYSNTIATTTDATLYAAVGAVVYKPISTYAAVAYTGAPFHRDDTFVVGVGTSFTSELRVNDEIMINGTECVVSNIVSDTSMRVTYDFPQSLTNGVISSTGTVGSVAGSGPYTATISNLSNVTGLAVGSNITATAGTGFLGSNNISTTATVASVSYVSTGSLASGPWTATLTGLTSTAGVALGATLSATSGTGALYSGVPTTVVVTSILSASSLTYTVTGGSIPIAGSITNVLATSTTVVTGITSLPNGTGSSGGGNGAFTINIQSVNTPSAGTITNITSLGAPIFKKQKIHGFILEGTREGSGTAGKLSVSSTTVVAAGTVYPVGTVLITAALITNFSTYGFIKVQGAGGPAVAITGYAGQSSASPAYAIAAGTTLTGTNTLFTQQLHVGAEIVVGQQYLTVTAIASDTSLTVAQTMTAMIGPLPIYRTTPLYTWMTVSGSNITLGTNIKNTIYSIGANPPTIFTPNTSTDFIEYVYSAPNVSATTTNLLFNTSYDRKYFGFRFFPLQQGNANSSVSGQANTLAGAGSAYSMPVYERWFAGYNQGNGAGINLADQSGGTMANVSQSTTTITVNATFFGTVSVGQYYINGTAALTGGSVTANSYITAGSGTSFTSTQSATLTNAPVTMGTGIPLPTVVATSGGAAIGYNFNTDIVGMYQQTGGFIYLFAQPTYVVMQGKSSSNIQSNWIGCVEFERAQPEDVGTGLGSTTGITYTTLSGSVPVSGTPGISPWPTYGYVNSLRFATGASPIATQPINNAAPTHGCVIAVPRVRESTGDLVGVNAHIYSAFTITTGRWGHLYEFGGVGSYQGFGGFGTNQITTPTANTLPQPSMGQLVPVYTNVYNSKRFMFSPVVVLGTAYDPDIRGRLYSLKVIPSNLGTLMDTVSVLVDSNYFYSTTGAATDHWVLTGGTAGTSVGVIQTYSMAFASSSVTQQWRPLEFTGTTTAQSGPLVSNNFRWAIPA